MIDIKNAFHKQSAIQVTLFKVTFSIFVFLIIYMCLYGQSYWQTQALKLNYHALSITSNVQSTLQSRISNIEELKNNQNLSKSQKASQIDSLIQPIIRQYNNEIVGYYDIGLDLVIRNQNQNNITSNRIRSIIRNETLQNESIVMVNVPIYNEEKLVGYVWSYTENSNSIFDSFSEASKILILALSLSTLIIFFIRKCFKQIEFYLGQFCKMVIEDDCFEKDQILTKMPELKPVFNKITSFTDDLKHMNQELESSKLKITKIMEGITDGFYALDRCWQFEFVNTETLTIIGEDNIELLGRNIWEVFPQLVGSLSYEKMQEAMSRNQSVHWEAGGFVNSDQNYEYHAYSYKEGLSIFFRDITELKRQQQELERLERLNLIGQLAAGISHEIRNPMTTVKGFLQFFGSKPKYAQDKEYMDLMILEIDRANTIITDFLSLAKANSDNIKSQNINEIIYKLFPMLQADAYNSNKEVVLELNVLSDIMINENEIIQLILNLVRNALEVTPEQGSVIISTYLKKEKVVLAIKDQGQGIPQEIQGKIGTPFFTTKETGTGLGLAISIGIAHRHNAIFEFVTGNNGSTFSTSFPIPEIINT